MSDSLSNRLYGIKLICVLTIVLAHTPLNYLDGEFCVSLLKSFSHCGVPIYFIMSGYFFHKTNKDFESFWITKLTTIIIPWFIAGGLNYVKSILSNGNFSAIRMLTFTLGLKSFLYYMSAICLFYIIFWKFKNNKNVLWFSVLVTVIMKYLISFDLVPEIFSKNINMLRWIGFFSLGIIADRNNLVKKLFDLIEKYRLISIISSVSGILFSIYFDRSWLIEQISWTVIICNIVMIHNKNIESSMSLIGKTTFSIYLYHQFLTTRILTNDNQLTSVACAIIRPVIIVAMMSIVFIAGYYISKKISIKLNKTYVLITGTRI